MHPRMGGEPLLDGGAGVTGQIVTDQIEVPCGIGLLDDVEELKIASGIARRRGDGELLPVADS